MPRGEHFKEVEDEQLLSAMDRQAEVVGRWALTPKEIAEDDEITIQPQSVRTRIEKIEDVERVKISKAVLWKRKKRQLFVDPCSIKREREKHLMGQMGVRRIGSLTVGIAAVGLVMTTVPSSLVYPVSLALAAILGLVMIAWGAAPLVSALTAGEQFSEPSAATVGGGTDE